MRGPPLVVTALCPMALFSASAAAAHRIIGDDAYRRHRFMVSMPVFTVGDLYGPLTVNTGRTERPAVVSAAAPY